MVFPTDIIYNLQNKKTLIHVPPITISRYQNALRVSQDFDCTSHTMTADVQPSHDWCFHYLLSCVPDFYAIHGVLLLSLNRALSWYLSQICSNYTQQWQMHFILIPINLVGRHMSTKKSVISPREANFYLNSQLLYAAYLEGPQIYPHNQGQFLWLFAWFQTWWHLFFTVKRQ